MQGQLSGHLDHILWNRDSWRIWKANLRLWIDPDKSAIAFFGLAAKLQKRNTNRCTLRHIKDSHNMRNIIRTSHEQRRRSSAVLHGEHSSLAAVTELSQRRGSSSGGTQHVLGAGWIQDFGQGVRSLPQVFSVALIYKEFYSRHCSLKKVRSQQHRVGWDPTAVNVACSSVDNASHPTFIRKSVPSPFQLKLQMPAGINFHLVGRINSRSKIKWKLPLSNRQASRFTILLHQHYSFRQNIKICIVRTLLWNLNFLPRKFYLCTKGRCVYSFCTRNHFYFSHISQLLAERFPTWLRNEISPERNICSINIFRKRAARKRFITSWKRHSLSLNSEPSWGWFNSRICERTESSFIYKT